jgi:hypothetical protein
MPLTHIKLIGASNYLVWAKRSLMNLKACGLHKYVTEEPKMPNIVEGIGMRLYLYTLKRKTRYIPLSLRCQILSKALGCDFIYILSKEKQGTYL